MLSFVKYLFKTRMTPLYIFRINCSISHGHESDMEQYASKWHTNVCIFLDIYIEYKIQHSKLYIIYWYSSNAGQPCLLHLVTGFHPNHILCHLIHLGKNLLECLVHHHIQDTNIHCFQEGANWSRCFF